MLPDTSLTRYCTVFGCFDSNGVADFVFAACGVCTRPWSDSSKRAAVKPCMASETKAKAADGTTPIVGETKMSFADGQQLVVEELAPRGERARRGMRRGRDDGDLDAAQKQSGGGAGSGAGAGVGQTAKDARPVAKRPHVDMKSKEKESRPDRKYECKPWSSSRARMACSFLVFLTPTDLDHTADIQCHSCTCA